MTTSYRGVHAMVLGASGFIGRWVARALSREGALVTSVVRDADAMRTIAAHYGISGDIEATDVTSSDAVRALLAARRPAITFNLAGYGIDRSERDDTLAWRINAELVREVGALVLEHHDTAWQGMRLVHAGSALEYGPIGGHLPESSIEAPDTLYGRTKCAGTNFLRAFKTDAVVTARLFTVYGAGEHSGRLLPTLLAAQHHGDPVPLSMGTQQRDFTYVEEVADLLLAIGALPAVAGSVVNVASGTLTSVRDFATIAARVLHIAHDRLHFGAIASYADETPHDIIANDRLRSLIGVVPQVGVADGVARTGAWLTP